MITSDAGLHGIGKRVRKPQHRGLMLGCLTGLLVAASFSTSAVAATPHASAPSAYAQLAEGFHRMLSVRSSQIRADELTFEKTTAPCLTRALTATLVAQAPGSAEASAARAAFKPLLFEVAIQMIMQSSKPLMTQYVRTLKLAIAVSGLKGAKRAQAVAFGNLFAEAQGLRTCADAATWAAAGYAPASEPRGASLTGQLAKVTSGSFPTGGRFQGFTSAQTAGLARLVKQTAKLFQSVIKQIDHRGAPWLTGVLLRAERDAAQQTATTTTTTPTTTSTTPTTTTG